MNNKSVYLKIIVNYLLTILTVLAIIFLAPKFIAFLWPFVVGWIIALIANPLVRVLEKRLKILRKHGTAIVIIFVLAVVIGLLYLLVYFIIDQAVSFSKNLPQMYAAVSESMSGVVADMKERFTFLPDKVFVFLDGAVNNLGGLVNDIAVSFIDKYDFSINDAGIVVKSVAEALFMTIITILNSYFLTAEHDKIIETYKRIIPERVKKVFSTVSKCTVSAFGGYFKAQFKIMCVIFLMLVIGLLCIGADYAILFAFIISFIDFLPVFGSGAILWPWCIIEIISGRYIIAIVLFALYLLCQAVKQFMQPKMVGDSIGMKPLTTLFFMFVGYRFGGVLGMIIGIPVGMILISFYREGVFDNLIRGGKILISAYDKWKKF